MKILTLDLGTKTGWAVHDGGHITSGQFEFKNDRFEGGGMRYLKFKHWLSQIHQLGPVDLVVFEEVRRHVGTTAAHVYGGFLAHLTAWCETEKIPYNGVPVATIKAHATGGGKAKKGAIIEAMRAKGHAPKDDNEADALAILYYAMDMVPKPVPRPRKQVSSCGYCEYEEADGELISQCKACKSKDDLSKIKRKRLP